MGAMRSHSAVQELKKLLADTSTRPKLQEAARARYVIGFIRRCCQYQMDQASAQDLCLNIRDIVLVLGRVKLTEKLYSLVQTYGKHFDLVCENDLQVSCLMHIPEWLEPAKYIQDVYGMKQDEGAAYVSPSAGDELLRRNTIFSSYKSYEQKLAVHTALKLPAGHTLLISLPTGGGKSLVTQMLSGTSAGLTVVIVPTVALALDQYYAARQNLRDDSGIYCYRGEQSAAERDAIIQALRERKAGMLFTSPEAVFKNPELFRLLDTAAEERYLADIVVDEAHVVPDWGVFFRPDFQIFSIVLKKWRRSSGNHIRTFLLSATLSDDVVDTLFSLFGSEGCNVQVRCDALRPEPRFYFRSVKSKKEQEDKTAEAVRLLPKPMVIYVLEPREASALQKRLKQEGYQNIPLFTGETREAERDRVLKGWKDSEFDVVIATSAFGIGVDKPDVRSVLHACCPENLSRYYQEVGRGGRDGLPSVSLFLPYQSQYDKSADVRRALGLVNKRVLTVARAVIRWNGMLKSPHAIIDGDECILDTSSTPSTMTEEEAEYAGNRNAAWNINLLLFLYRVGFIDLEDAGYMPQKGAYTVKVKLLRPDILGNSDRFAEALEAPRQAEYETQMKGYSIIRDLAASPRAMCWGRIFRHLFPLSREICSGCPSDPEGRISADAKYKLRLPPAIQLPPAPVSRRLERNMGAFDELVVRRQRSGACTLEEAADVAARASRCGLGCMVLPKRLADEVKYEGLVLDYDEFYFAAANTPYLFAGGVLCVFENDAHTNLTLYKNLSRLRSLGYRTILYCSENMVITSNGKSVRECIDGYTIPVETL